MGRLHFLHGYGNFMSFSRCNLARVRPTLRRSYESVATSCANCCFSWPERIPIIQSSMFLRDIKSSEANVATFVCTHTLCFRNMIGPVFPTMVWNIFSDLERKLNIGIERRGWGDHGLQFLWRVHPFTLSIIADRRDLHSVSA